MSFGPKDMAEERARMTNGSDITARLNDRATWFDVRDPATADLLREAEGEILLLRSALQYEHRNRVIHNVRGESPPCRVCDLLSQTPEPQTTQPKCAVCGLPMRMDETLIFDGADRSPTHHKRCRVPQTPNPQTGGGLCSAPVVEHKAPTKPHPYAGYKPEHECEVTHPEGYCDCACNNCYSVDPVVEHTAPEQAPPHEHCDGCGTGHRASVERRKAP